MRKVFKISIFILLVLIIAVAAIGIYVKTALPDVGAAPAVTIKATPAMVAHGKYLANNVLACMDCHSKRNWNLYTGPVTPASFGGGGEQFNHAMGFPGNLYSKNITPYALHNWTDGEIFRAITTGETKNGIALFPVMPYPDYSHLDSEDVFSIIAYLRTLTPLQNEVPERQLDFPLSIIVNTMPAKATLAPVPDTNNIVAYGNYLITVSGCADCHSKIKNGTKVAGTEFGGGRQFHFPNGTVTTAPNITSDMQTGTGTWTSTMFVNRFKLYSNASYKPATIGKDDFNSPMPWMMYTCMTEKDLNAIYAALRTIKPISNKVQKFKHKTEQG